MDNFIQNPVKPKKSKSSNSPKDAAVTTAVGSPIPIGEDDTSIEAVVDVESHPKSVKLVELLSEYFIEEANIARKSKTIVFTQSRNSA